MGWFSEIGSFIVTDIPLGLTICVCDERNVCWVGWFSEIGSFIVTDIPLGLTSVYVMNVTYVGWVGSQIQVPSLSLTFLLV